jgi:hypothetical protein
MTVKRRIGRVTRSTCVAVVMLAALSSAGAGDTAHEATPVATPGPLLPARPATIRGGTCTTPGEIIAPLTDLTLPRGARLGQAPRALLVQGSLTPVSLPLPFLLKQPHLIEIRQAAPESVIACGEIGGPLDAVGTLHVGLRDVADSGFTGIAHLTPTVDGGGTDVAVFVTGDVPRGVRRATAVAGGTGAAAGPADLSQTESTATPAVGP